MHHGDGLDPIRGVGECILGLVGVGTARLEAQQRGHCLEVVLHPVVDLTDRGVLGDQLAFAVAQLGDVAAQHQYPDLSPVLAQLQDAGADAPGIVLQVVLPGDVGAED